MADTAAPVGRLASTSRDARRRRPLWRTALAGLGEVLMTAGVVALLFVAYELWGTGAYTSHAQAALERGLTATTWAAQTPQISVPPPVGLVAPRDPGYPPLRRGDAVARLYIPALGADYRYVVVEGVDREQLERGPGHYPGTALPGQLGNLVISGHRTTYLAPFNRIDELRPGDAVIFETARAWYVYRVADIPGYRLRHQEVVLPTDVGETEPVPNRPGQPPTERIFTLTTCNPKYSARQRLIVHGVLDRVVAKPGPPPRELHGGRR